MKTTLSVLTLGIIFIVFTAFQCDQKEGESGCDITMSQLEKLNERIQNLVDTSVCHDDAECRYIAYGSKPCGGPWSYLLYSTSIDTLQLTTLVEEYNALETRVNQECERISDCMAVIPPQRLECRDGKCVAVYE